MMLVGEALPPHGLGAWERRIQSGGDDRAPFGAAAPAPGAGPSTRGPPVSHGGYAGVTGVVSGGHAPNPAESVGHEACARAASRCADRPRPPSVHAPSGSRGDERERSPKGRTALAAALAAAAAEAEAAISTDAYMPNAAPEVDAGVHTASSAANAGLGDAVDEARITAATAAAVLRCVVDARGPAADVEAAKADVDAAHAAAEAAAAAAAAPGPVAAAAEAAATAAAHAEAAAAAPAAGAAAASAVAAAAPVPGRACASAARRPSKGGKDGKGGEAVAHRAFVESAFAQADAGATLDGRGLAAPGYADDADDSAGSDV